MYILLMAQQVNFIGFFGIFIIISLFIYIVAGSDYTALESPQGSLRLPVCEKTLCLLIHIVDDEVLEDVEYFVIRVEGSFSSSRLKFKENEKHVMIVDLDGM